MYLSVRLRGQKCRGRQSAGGQPFLVREYTYIHGAVGLAFFPLQIHDEDAKAEWDSLDDREKERSG